MRQIYKFTGLDGMNVMTPAVFTWKSPQPEIWANVCYCCLLRPCMCLLEV